MATDKPKLLFLDDCGKRILTALNVYSEMYDVSIATSVIEFLRLASREDFKAWSLDHDLGGREFVDPDDPTCGMEIVRYLEKTTWPTGKRMPNVVIHSSNDFAATEMEHRLERLGFLVVRQKMQYV